MRDCTMVDIFDNRTNSLHHHFQLVLWFGRGFHGWMLGRYRAYWIIYQRNQRSEIGLSVQISQYSLSGVFILIFEINIVGDRECLGWFLGGNRTSNFGYLNNCRFVLVRKIWGIRSTYIRGHMVRRLNIDWILSMGRFQN